MHLKPDIYESKAKYHKTIHSKQIYDWTLKWNNPAWFIITLCCTILAQGSKPKFIPKVKNQNKKSDLNGTNAPNETKLDPNETKQMIKIKR